MTPEEKLKALETLIGGSFCFVLNMNDTFEFSSGDAEEMETEDVELMLPIIQRYGSDALVAYSAVKRGAEPIDCKCNHKNERYYAAKEEILKIKSSADYFMGKLRDEK